MKKRKTDSKVFLKKRAKAGGTARAKKLSAKERAEIARKAALVRWENQNGK